LNETDDGQVENSYTLSKVHDGRRSCCDYGGFVGKNESGATITNVYASGHISHANDRQSSIGGLVGFDATAAGAFENTYWNLDKGVSDPSQGAGNIDNDPGITGLTTEQFQKGLPEGFDPKIWASDPKINDGYPYLLANPPP